MRSVQAFNDGWVFHEGFSPKLAEALSPGKAVSLPHTAVELPFNYFDEKSYQRAFTYQKVIKQNGAGPQSEIALVFDGAMADAKVYVNGKQVIAHRDGYTPFEVRLTGLL